MRPNQTRENSANLNRKTKYNGSKSGAKTRSNRVTLRSNSIQKKKNKTKHKSQSRRGGARFESSNGQGNSIGAVRSIDRRPPTHRPANGFDARTSHQPTSQRDPVVGQTAKQPTRTKKKINNNNQKNSADGNELNGPRTDRIAAGGAQQQQRKRAGPKFQQLTQQQQQNPVNVTRDGQLSKQAQPTTTPSIAAPKTGKGCLEIDATVTIRRTIDNRKKKPVKAGARVGKRVAMDPVKSEPTAQPPPQKKKKTR